MHSVTIINSTSNGNTQQNYVSTWVNNYFFSGCCHSPTCTYIYVSGKKPTKLFSLLFELSLTSLSFPFCVSLTAVCVITACFVNFQPSALLSSQTSQSMLFTLSTSVLYTLLSTRDNLSRKPSLSNASDLKSHKNTRLTLICFPEVKAARLEFLIFPATFPLHLPLGRQEFYYELQYCP